MEITLPPTDRVKPEGDFIRVDPEIMSGTPCFSGTRLPVQTLVDFLAAGETIDDFLEGFPGVTREQAVAFFKTATEKIVRTAGAKDERAA